MSTSNDVAGRGCSQEGECVFRDAATIDGEPWLRWAKDGCDAACAKTRAGDGCHALARFFALCIVDIHGRM